MKLHPAEQYIKEVLADKKQKTHGLYVRQAVQRHVNDLKNGRKRGLLFDPKEAQRWIDFAHLFYHWKNKEFSGKKIALEPHQQFYFWCLFGWRMKDGTRRFRNSYKEIARKNGKTTECALKAHGHIFLDGEMGAQVWFAATKKDQALIGLNDAAKVAKATKNIDAFYEYTALKDKFLRIIHPTTGSYMGAIGRDTHTEDGFDPSYGIIDEMHAHPDLSAIEILESGMGARKEPIIDVITTAGLNKRSPCYSTVRKTVTEILAGIKEDDHYFGIIYTLDDDDDWEDESNWVKANPNLGVSVWPEYMKSRYTKAVNEGGETEVGFKTKNLNLWTDAPRVWIPDRTWMQNKAMPEGIEGKIWYAGLDLASTEDFNAWLLFSEPDAEEKHDILPFFWIPEDKLAERQRKDKNNYRDWIANKYLKVTPGNVTDYDFIEDFIAEQHEKLQILAGGFDKWNALSTANRLNALGFEYIQVGQTINTLTAPTKRLKTLTLGRKLRHGGHPVLRWMCANSVVRMDANENIRLDKENSNEKIDGMAALVNAIAVYMQKNEYESDQDWGISSVTL